jgi:hypothetical protein
VQRKNSHASRASCLLKISYSTSLLCVFFLFFFFFQLLFVAEITFIRL